MILSLPAFLFGQSASSPCEKVFTKSEQIPSLKISKESFADTLAATLQTKKFPRQTGEITYIFILTTASQIEGLYIESGGVKKENKLKESILHLADQWNPAIQNGHVVCSYVTLKLVFKEDKINIDIRQ